MNSSCREAWGPQHQHVEEASLRVGGSGCQRRLRSSHCPCSARSATAESHEECTTRRHEETWECERVVPITAMPLPEAEIAAAGGSVKAAPLHSQSDRETVQIYLCPESMDYTRQSTSDVELSTLPPV